MPLPLFAWVVLRRAISPSTLAQELFSLQVSGSRHGPDPRNTCSRGSKKEGELAKSVRARSLGICRWTADELIELAEAGRALVLIRSISRLRGSVIGCSYPFHVLFVVSFVGRPCFEKEGLVAQVALKNAGRPSGVPWAAESVDSLPGSQ